MAQSVVHFEIIGKNPKRLRSHYSDLFGWDFVTHRPSPKKSPNLTAMDSSTS